MIILVLFTMSVCLFYLLAAWGISAYLANKVHRNYVTGPGVYWEVLIFGLSFGLLLAVVNAWSDAPRVKRLPFAWIIFLKSLLYLVSLALAWTCVLLVFRLFLFSPAELNSIIGSVTPRFLISVSIWLTTCILVINFVMEVRRRVGPGNLSALFTGRYRRPRIEDRIFLFLDLTEIGDIKREIAYHGDPINTAARLLELSKNYEDMLIISDRMKAEISSSVEFLIEHQGETLIRGKPRRSPYTPYVTKNCKS